jgi:hypothetical protein
MIPPYPFGLRGYLRAVCFFLPFFVKKKAMDTFHGLIIKNKKAMGACPAHPWLSLYSARLRGMGEPS